MRRGKKKVALHSRKSRVCYQERSSTTTSNPTFQISMLVSYLMRHQQVARVARVLALPFLLVLTIAAQSPAPTAIHAEIQQTYNFQPHTLTGAEIDAKSALLDQFWKKAKAQRNIYAPALRKELTDFSNPPFFLYDGASLLSTLSNDPADHKIILNAIARSDMRDLQSREYVLFVHKYAALGDDTTPAAFNILATPKFSIFIPEHFLTLAQNYCLIYMLLPTDQNFWLQPAISRLHDEKDETAQKSLLLLLWYAQTPEADNALADFANDAARPQASRTYANELIHRKDKIGLSARASATTSSEQSLRDARRARMKAVSDEALYDLDDYTNKIIAKRK
jgi:hypothetical protein